MTIYVDSLRDFSRVLTKPIRIKYGTDWCWMASDSQDPHELHIFAQAIGLKLEWAKNTRGFTHYDLAKYMRERACDNGAVQVTSMELMSRCAGLLKGESV